MKSPVCAANQRRMCAQDILYWVSTYLWIFEPKTAKELFFIPWNFQEEAMLVLEDSLGKYDVVVEKTREMAASWSCLTVIAHKWMFHGRQMFLGLSRKEDLVDQTENPDSLFWKFDYLVERQPSFLRPRRYRDNRFSMNAHNPRTKATFTGESTNKFAGVGGRRMGVLADEFSKMKEQDTILSGTRDVSRSRWFVFTPQGTGNASHRIATNPKIRKITMHWSIHPEKSAGLYRVGLNNEIEVIDKEWHEANPGYVFRAERPDNPKYSFRSPWYDGECDRASHGKEIAQELDIDYLGSQYTYYDPREIERLIANHAMNPFYVGELTFGPDCKPTGFVASDTGYLKLWIHPRPDGSWAMPEDRTYAMGVDISEGTGATNSCFSIADCRTGEKVVEYANPTIEPHDLAAYCIAAARWFAGAEEDGCKIAYEAPGPGISFRKALVSRGYMNIYWRKKHEKKAFSQTSDIPGWWPSVESKKEAHADYRRCLNVGRFVNHSEPALRECVQYVWTPAGEIIHADDINSIDPTGAGAQHGDRVVADMLACKIMLEYDLGEAPKPVVEPSPRSLAGRMAMADFASGEEYDY